MDNDQWKQGGLSSHTFEFAANWRNPQRPLKKRTNTTRIWGMTFNDDADNAILATHVLANSRDALRDTFLTRHFPLAAHFNDT